MKLSYHRSTYPLQPLSLAVTEAEIFDLYQIGNSRKRTFQELPMPQSPCPLRSTR